MLKVQSSSIEALVLRGEAYYYMMELDLAMRHFREGLRMDPEHKVRYNLHVSQSVHEPVAL